MSLFIIEEEDVLPAYSDLEDLPAPDSSLEGRSITFDAMRHELDQMFESDVILDMDAPEAIARAMESGTLHFNA